LGTFGGLKIEGIVYLSIEPTHNEILNKIISQIHQNKLDRFCKFY